jgi:hypothetical protein
LLQAAAVEVIHQVKQGQAAVEQVTHFLDCQIQEEAQVLRLI